MTASVSERPYHHGNLRAALLAAAVDEVRAVGPTAASLREIARRAGVSHAAPAHHFGDKAGLFTAIAAEGFRLIGERTGAVALNADGFLPGGLAYVEFAIEHPGHFAVMFRPDLYHADDPDLAVARETAFAVLTDSARLTLAGPAARPVPDEDVDALVLAGWSMAHGVATLLLSGALPEDMTTSPDAVAARFAHGSVLLGDLARRALGG